MELKYPPVRRKSRAVKAGKVIIGGGFPISVQSMTTTDTRDTAATVAQIKRLEAEGCDIVRVAVLDDEAVSKLAEIKSQIAIPLVADIHFKYKLALESIRQGVDKIRINPGNIGDDWKVKEIVRAAKDAGIPIRVGVNSGSLPKDLLEKYGHDHPEGFVQAALRQIEILESIDFHDIVISLKSTNVNTAYFAHMMLAEKIDYPFHLGITEAGTLATGTVKSAVGLGAILINGIGDTIRVSLTADPVEEVRVGKAILKALELKKEGVEVIACPTCGRCRIDLIPLAEAIEQKTRRYKTPLKVAVMGCIVNGPGEAAAADIGIAGGDGMGILFKKGEIIGKVEEKDLEAALLKEIEILTGGK
ncbi:MAG: flavodoxin-dependent (E)-4-hydroxy-3-methylbut-2-enyl-diphosphate synthase [candidate division Zixibacteria bacterium]|nr:flavodoxin-dependent (E)-4-hydroxy-3-methylbut-2-enyl-diphosphate synthase [candidate division Zixibacteria bacterium]